MLHCYRSTPYDPHIVRNSVHQHGDWLRVEQPTEEEVALLVGLGIDADTISDALDPNEVPRVDHEDDWTYFITRLPDTDDDFNDFTTPILFALGRKYIVTLSRDSLGRLWQPFVDTATVATSDRETMFFTMMDALARSYQARVAKINREMRAVTRDIHRLKPADIATLVEYERKLNDYLDALIPTNASMAQIRAGRHMRIDDDDRDVADDLTVDMEQVISRCKSLLRTINNLRDSYLAVMNTRLNETIRILTVATLAITIPTMLAGLYGMNVELPGATWPGTFATIILVSLVAAVLLIYYFLRRR